MPEKQVVLKPTRPSTLSWLQVSLIVSICGIPPPDGLVLNWLSDQPLVIQFFSTSPVYTLTLFEASTQDTRGPNYVALMRAVYNLANRPSFPVLTSSLLHILFVNLKSDALVFLAGVWTSESPMLIDNSFLHEIALRHAAAFLEAHVLEDDGVDFQTIVPALLIALQGAIGSVREAAVECLSRIRLISEKKLKNVYKFDIIYGDAKGVYIPLAMPMWMLTK